MDPLIASWPSEPDEDLRLCISRGVAYQADMSRLIAYDDPYFYHYSALEGQEIGVKLNAGRVAMVQRYAETGARVLDIGAGAGSFVKAARSWGFDAYGLDINPRTVRALKEMGAYSEDVESADVVTYWDSLEHIPCPADLLARVRIGAAVLVALPVFSDLRRVRESKHYKPGEHLYYFSPAGFNHWMEHQGFEMVEDSDHEVKAGREAIGAYAFRKISEPLQ